MALEKIDLDNIEYYENRELSWLEFNQRVLEEAENSDNPLFERLKFLSIVSSNLDEFFMVRVASLKEQVIAKYDKEDFAGLNPKDQLDEISIRTHKMVNDQVNHYNRSLLKALRKEKIVLHQKIDGLNESTMAFLKNYFDNIVFPVLTPLAVDSSRPFPLILNKSLNIAVLLVYKEKEEFATVQIPSMLDRFIEVPFEGDDNRHFVLLEDIVGKYIQRLFVGYEVLAYSTYRITRNGDLSIDEGEAEDLLIEIEKSVRKRKWGQAIRLELSKGMDEKLISFLKKALNIKEKDIYYVGGPLDFTFLMKFYSLKGTDHLKYKQFRPQWPRDLMGERDIFDLISEKDILLHHPYQSFEPIVDFIKKSAMDENVLAIKQTLYRVSGSSPIIRALSHAAESGKQVTVLVELKARFDEENNIQWARRLEKAGCHVIYGLVGLKTHSKITLVVRREEAGIKRYVHLGTGNYNDITAKLYTDMGLLTTNEIIASDASVVFNALSGYSETPKLKKISMAPIGLRDKFNYLIRREASHAKNGKEAKIVCKMNSLCDKDIIKELYRASMAGVKIKLIVRGICSLIPGIEGVSDNIEVISIVGKYLEHSRIFYFYNNGVEEVFLSSADFMPRNLNRRVELLFPVEQDDIKERIKNVLDISLRDVVKARKKTLDKKYVKIDKRGKEIINSQEYFEEQAMRASKEFEKEVKKEVFVPISKPKTKN